MLEYFTWYSEATVHYRLAAASVAAGKHIGKSVYVMDMRGFGITKFGAEMRAFLKTFTKIASENYPEVRARVRVRGRGRVRARGRVRGRARARASA